MNQPAPDDVVLSINSGSSSLKLSVFAVGDGSARSLFDGSVEIDRTDVTSALSKAFARIEEARVPKPTIVGHRVVHGGAQHVAPALIDDALIASLRGLVPLAPLHMPAAIAGIEAVRERDPHLPQVACFDTAFHASMPEIARRLPLPERFDREGVRRYGFHGLSYEYVMSTLGVTRPARIVIAHLGNGSSLVAVKDGKAIDTTMGFTPAGGVMMGTRTGDLDPGVFLYMLRERHMSANDLEHLIEKESGLLGVGDESDVKTLLARAPKDERAQLALSMFGYSVKKAIGGLMAAMGGIDLLVFTGGIGEHAAPIRAFVCEGLEALGIRLDTARNERNAETISAALSPVAVRVVATDEDRMIARHARSVVRGLLDQASNEST